MGKRRHGGCVVALVVVSCAVCVACSASHPKAVNVAPAVPSRCPDLAKAEELAAFDFASEFGLARGAGDVLKAAALASMELGLLDEKLDAELGIACSQIAHDLGDKGDWRSGNEACAAAVAAVHEAREKLDRKATVRLVVRAPVCLASASFTTKCASLCDSSAPADRLKIACEQKAGRCDGTCSGVCETSAPTRCAGACNGSCEGVMQGRCGGRCKGTCDGKFASGACQGRCVGTCENGPMEGECKGACRGSCTRAPPGICDGLCAGTCSVELSDAKCSGTLTPPDVSAPCRTRCDLALVNHTDCSTPHVGLVITGAPPRDRERVEAMTISVAKSYPALLKILFEVGEAARSRTLEAQELLASTRRTFASRVSGVKRTEASAQTVETQLTTCFGEAFKNAELAATRVMASVDQAQGIRDELTK